MMKQKFFSLIVGSVLTSALAATEDEDNSKTTPKKVPGETVTITAEADSVEVAKTPNPVIVVDAEKLSRIGSNRLLDVIDFALPGRAALKGYFGGQTSLFINGARSEDTVILLDGIQISSRDLGQDLSRYTLSGIERVEILPMPSSTLYGADVHGGVISLFSGAPTSQGISGHAFAQVSTLGQARIGAQASYGWESGWLQGGGDTEQRPQNPTGAKNPYREASGHIGFGQRFASALITLNHHSSYIGAPIPLVWDAEYDPITWEQIAVSRRYDDTRETLTRQSITTASLKNSFNANLYGGLSIGNINQEYLNDTNNGDVSNLSRYQGNVFVTWSGDRGGATLLSDFISEEYWKDDRNKKYTGQHTALAIEGHMEVLPVLRLVASARQQWDDLESGNVGWNPAFDTISLSQLTWKVGANFLVPSGFRAYASTGTAFNTPILYNLGLNASQGKPAPGNERSRSILAGIGYEQAKWWLKADVSRLDYSDLNFYVGSYPNAYFVNMNNIRIQGLELTAGTRGSNWDAELFARSQEGRALERPEAQQLAWFQNRPFFLAGLRANWMLKTAFLGVNINYYGHKYTYSDDLGPVADKTHFVDCSLRTGMQLSTYITVTLRAERLFQDKLSREDWENEWDIGRNNVSFLRGYPVPGREFGLEIRYKF